MVYFKFSIEENEKLNTRNYIFIQIRIPQRMISKEELPVETKHVKVDIRAYGDWE